MRKFTSHGTGEFARTDFRAIGENVIFERGVLVFHPAQITLGNNVYVGHNAILKGYHQNEMTIGDDVWKTRFRPSRISSVSRANSGPR